MKSLFKTFLITLIFLFFTSSIGFAAATFKTITYTGNGSTQSISGVGFKPDLVWIKNRTVSNWHVITDSVRGTPNAIFTNSINGQGADPNNIQSLDEDGFTVGAYPQVNGNGQNLVAWCWKADQPGITNSNQTEKYSTKSGLSIIKYTGTGTDKTIQHSLGVSPKMVIIKGLGNSYNWHVYHSGLSGQTYGLQLNTNVNESNIVNFTTFVSSTEIGIGTSYQCNQPNIEFIAYVFSEVSGVSSFSSYQGNGLTNGPTIECGFEPAYLMLKSVDSNEGWVILDNERKITNPINATLDANTSDAEIPNTHDTDFTETGFQIKNAGSRDNQTGIKYIYMAFAEYEAPQISFSDPVN